MAKVKTTTPAVIAPKFTISQSFMKDMKSYLAARTCGEVIESKYVRKDFPDQQSEAMKLGSYFEYILTGAPMRDGTIPKPSFMISKIKDKKKLKGNEDKTDEWIITQYNFGIDEMYDGYRMAHRNAVRVKQMMKDMGITIKATQVHVVDGKYDGHLDVIADYNGEEVTIDIKYSGLIEDKWNEMGWMMTPEQIEYHKVQAVHYTGIGKRPMYYLICSSTNEDQIKFIRMTVDDFAIEQHFINADELYKRFDYDKKIGFNIYPEYTRCKTCALFSRCSFKTQIPKVEVVHINE